MSRVYALLLLLNCSNALCGVGEDLEGFFHKVGATTNATSPGIHHDQAAGYYNGGGLSIRNRTRNSQLATLQLPSFKAGCGGIDMFTGGFSFISSAELVNALKSIGSSAVSYGFMLAMKTFAPSVQSVMAELQDFATKINQANINSCEAAATLLGGVWPKLDLTSRHICSSIGSKDGVFKDWAAARQGCGTGGQHTGVLAKKGTTEEYKNILSDEFNVAWEVLKKNSFLATDPELAELCMTISGTIIAYKEGDEVRKVRTLESKADKNDLIQALFRGGNVSLYSCVDRARCLNVQEKQHTIATAKAFEYKINNILNEIKKKTITDSPLTPEEIAFIGKVRLPLYKLVNVLTAYKRTEYDLRDFTDIICVDLVHQYITEILDVMLEETVNLKNVQVSDEEINRFITQLQKAKEAVNARRQIAYEQMNQMLIMIETAKTFERKLENTFEILQKEHQ